MFTVVAADAYLGTLYSTAGSITVTAALNSVNIYAAFLAAAQTLTENNVPREGRWGVAGTAPFEWKFNGELNSLAWLGLIVETPLNAEGHLVVDAERTGTMANPVLRGTVVGERLALRRFLAVAGGFAWHYVFVNAGQAVPNS